MKVALGMDPTHLLSASAAEVGFSVGSNQDGRSLPGLPLLSSLAGPV